MKNYLLKGVAIKDYNKVLPNGTRIKIEAGEEVIEERGVYEGLFAKCFVSEGTKVEDKPAKKVIIDKIKEED